MATNQKLSDITLAAYDFVDGMKSKADADDNGAPLWHGWALREAFEAGAKICANTQPSLNDRFSASDTMLISDLLYACLYHDSNIDYSWIKDAVIRLRKGFELGHSMNAWTVMYCDPSHRRYQEFNARYGLTE